MKTKAKRPATYDDNLMREICWEFAMMPCSSLDELSKKNEHWPTKRTMIRWLSEHPEFKELLSMAIGLKEKLLKKDF